MKNTTSDLMNWLKSDFNAVVDERRNRDEKSDCIMWDYVEKDLRDQHWDKTLADFKNIFEDLVFEHENARQPEFA